VVVNAVADGTGDFGFNAHTETYENLFDSGVIDPTKVGRVALENAVSIGGMVLTTECVIADVEEDSPAMPAGGGMPGGMGGMM
jgi:chaperonin GroEL